VVGGVEGGRAPRREQDGVGGEDREKARDGARGEAPPWLALWMSRGFCAPTLRPQVTSTTRSRSTITADPGVSLHHFLAAPSDPSSYAATNPANTPMNKIM